MPETPPLIDVRNAAFGYGGRAVVHADHLPLRRGECLGVFGHNGSGKTTLVRGLIGLLQPLGGEVVRTTQGPLRFGYLPQYRAIDTSWPMSGLDAASLATSAYGPLDAAARASVQNALCRLHADDLAGRSFATLSGGQQQRLLLAGALAAAPDVLVLDEPTDGLDVSSRDRLFSLLRELKTDGLCVAIISHDLEDLLAVGDRIAWLHPAAAPGGPSSVETITPTDLAERVLHGRVRR